MLDQYTDYAVPLLHLLTDLPGGEGTRADVAQQFLRRFRDEIPQDQFERWPSDGRERWYHKLGWAYDVLKSLGLGDTPKHGVWRITQAGRDWLVANPGASHVMKPKTGRSGRSETPERSATTVVPQGITLEMLEQTRQIMPPDQFRQIWGGIYDQVLAEERRKAITPVNDRFLAEKARHRPARPGLPAGPKHRVTEVRDGVRLDFHLLQFGAVPGRSGPLALRQQG